MELVAHVKGELVDEGEWTVLTIYRDCRPCGYTTCGTGKGIQLVESAWAYFELGDLVIEARYHRDALEPADG